MDVEGLLLLFETAEDDLAKAEAGAGEEADDDAGDGEQVGKKKVTFFRSLFAGWSDDDGSSPGLFMRRMLSCWIYEFILD